MKNRQPKQKIKLQDEIKSIKKTEFRPLLKFRRIKLQIPLHNLVKYSRIVQEEIMKNDICSELNKSFQKVSIRYKNSINTFLNLLNDEETEIKNEEFTDLLKLSEIYKVEQSKNVLKKYLQDHSKNVDFILSLKIEKENSKEEISILNDDVSEEMEECLKANINECLENDKIKEISVSSIYRMIEKSSREHISNDLLCRFIIESIKERHFLFKFVEIEKLSEEMFEELIKIYSKFNTSEHNQTHYFDFLPNNLIYIHKLISKQKSLEIQIKDLEKHKNNMIIENEQQGKKIQELMSKQKSLEKLEEIKDNITKENEQKIEKLIKISEEQKMKIQELENINENITKENKKKEVEIIEMRKQNEQQKMHVPFKIIEYLTKEVGGNVHDKGVVNVTSSSTNCDNYAKNAVDIYDKNICFSSENYKDSWLKYDFIEQKVHPTAYLITSIPTHIDYQPRNWVIEGSNNDNDWIILDTRQNETSLNDIGITCTFNIKPQEGNYRYLRIHQNGTNSSGSYYLIFSSLEIIGTLSKK